MKRAILLALVAVALSGCGGHPAPVRSLHIGQANEVAEPAPYLIQNGDLLRLHFVRADELTADYRVRPDGRITMPYLGDLLVEGLSPEVLHERLVRDYAPILKDPELVVAVVEFRQPSVFVGGQVDRPGVYEFTRGLTVFRAALVAGGFTDEAARSRVILIRNTGDRTPESFAVNLEQVFEAGSGARDPYLQPQDIIIVPRTNVSTAGLFVDQYIDGILPDLVERGFSYALGVVAADQAREWRDAQPN